MSKLSDRIEQLIALIRTGTGDDERARLEDLIEGDDELREVYSLLRQLEPDGESALWEQDDKALKVMAARIIEDFDQGRRNRKGEQGVLVYDSSIVPAPAGVRPAVQDSRELHYKFEDGDMTVSLYRISPDSFEMIGQVRGTDESSVSSLTLQAGRKVVKSKTDEFGVFRFERVPRRQCELIANREGSDTLTFVIDL